MYLIVFNIWVDKDDGDLDGASDKYNCWSSLRYSTLQRHHLLAPHVLDWYSVSFSQDYQDIFVHVDFIKLNNIFRALMLCFLNCLSDHAIASPLSVDSDIEFSHRFIFLFFFTNLRWPYVGTSIVVIGGPDVVGYWVLTGFSHVCSSVVCTPLCFFFSAVFSFLYFFKHPPVFIIFPPIPSTSATPPPFPQGPILHSLWM